MKPKKIQSTCASVPEPKPKKGIAPVTNLFIEWMYTNSSSLSVNDIALLLEQRRLFGLEKYGTELHTFNGRNAAEDIRQELGDLIIYFAQLILEEKAEEATELLNLAKESISTIEEFLVDK